MTFFQVGDALKSGAQQSPVNKILLCLKIKELLDKLLPQFLSNFSGKVVFHSFHKGRIVLSTPSPVASQEIFLQSKGIEEAINRKLQNEAVGEIKLKLKIKS